MALRPAARMRRGLAALVVSVLLGLLCAPGFAQCEMCKTGLIKSPEGAQMARGFNRGILFLLAMPYLLCGSVALALFIAHRKSL